MSVVIPVPSVVDELILWDRNDGITSYKVDDDTHKMWVTCFVPRELDTASHRSVRRHEFLHAVHDNPKGEYAAIDSEMVKRISNPAYQGIGDAFVHLVYWPIGADADADADVLEMAVEDLGRMVDDLDTRYSTNEAMVWDEKLTFSITLRSRAILRAVGTPARVHEADALQSELFPQSVLSAMDKVLDLVVQKARREAMWRADELSKRVVDMKKNHLL